MIELVLRAQRLHVLLKGRCFSVQLRDMKNLKTYPDFHGAGVFTYIYPQTGPHFFAVNKLAPH